jgi:hypothetical protein
MNYKGLGCKTFHEPTCLKASGSILKEDIHHNIGNKVVYGTNWTEDDHIISYIFYIPSFWLLNKFFIDFIGWDTQLTDIIEKIIKKDLDRQHGKER